LRGRFIAFRTEGPAQGDPEPALYCGLPRLAVS